ncbi:hypothetical protein PGT21_023440 [Puccinia graminis f. sp. tritici]|nr:hypothetical protein PGT21_023440 [Puccinia graminis f. sp. tritici]
MSLEEGRKSDERVLRALQLQNYHYTRDEWLSIEEVKELINICERESLTYHLVTAYYIAAQIYNAHGKTLEAGYFAEKAKKDGLIYFGPTWKYLDDAQILIDFPQNHDSYLNMRIEY